MKKTLFFVFILASLSSAQWNTGAAKIGYFSPSATEGGFIIGYEGGKHADRFLSWTWSIDWFHKNYVDKKLINELDQYYPGAIGELNELRATTNIHDFPVMLGLVARFPMSNRAQFYVSGGVGAELMLINYRNFQDPLDDDFDAAFDFNWRIGIGAAVAISPRSELFGELTYHDSHPGWTYESDGFDYPKSVLERSYNMSGFMTRIGIRFFY